MQTMYPYQINAIIMPLCRIAQAFEDSYNPAWHPLASAAACLERLLSGDLPADLEQVVTRLKALDPTDPGYRRPGKTYHFAVDMAITVLDGVRLGLIEVRPRGDTTPVFLGVDLAEGPDISVISPPCQAYSRRGGSHHA